MKVFLNLCNCIIIDFIILELIITLFLILIFKRGVVQLDRITDFGSLVGGSNPLSLTNAEPIRNCGFIFYQKGFILEPQWVLIETLLHRILMI